MMNFDRCVHSACNRVPPQPRLAALGAATADEDHACTPPSYFRLSANAQVRAKVATQSKHQRQE